MTDETDPITIAARVTDAVQTAAEAAVREGGIDPDTDEALAAIQAGLIMAYAMNYIANAGYTYPVGELFDAEVESLCAYVKNILHQTRALLPDLLDDT